MAFFRSSSGSGGSGYQLLKTEQLTFSSKTATLTGLTVGKEYMLIFSFGWSNLNAGADAKLASATNTQDLTLVDSAQESCGTTYCNTYWSIYTFKATGTTSVLTKSGTPNNGNLRLFLFEKV